MRVSIITAALNASATIARTIESVRTQTHPDWELLVIDNGSKDDTAALVNTWNAQDGRIRLLHQPTKGVSHARNLGLRAAQSDWVLFLDADDTLLPNALRDLTQAAQAQPRLTAVHGAWERIDPNGEAVAVNRWPLTGDLFPFFAFTCVFAIHSCLVRRKALLDAGGFPTDLTTCEDWDLWQRVSRAGARFGYVDSLVARYHMRKGSASNSGRRLAEDGILVVRRAHGPDARLQPPTSYWRNGEHPEKLPAALFHMLAWCAGLVIGSGEDAVPLLDLVAGVQHGELEPSLIPECILPPILLPECRKPDAWPSLWPEVAPNLQAYLEALERHNRIPSFAARAILYCQRFIADQLPAPTTLVLGDFAALDIDLETPLLDLHLPRSVQRLQCRLFVEGEALGRLELPVVDGRVSALVLADAVAAHSHWELIERFFKHHRYPQLRAIPTGFGDLVLSGRRPLATRLRRRGRPLHTAIHQELGWVCVLQDLWNSPNADRDTLLYGQLPLDQRAATIAVDDYEVMLEVSDPPRSLLSPLAELQITATVGGATLCEFKIKPAQGLVTSAALRTAIIRSAGKNLYQITAREALLGRALRAGKPNLRERLAEAVSAGAATTAADLTDETAGERWPFATPDYLKRLAATWAFDGAAKQDSLLPAHPFIAHRPGQYHARRALLPGRVHPQLAALAELTGETVLSPQCTGQVVPQPSTLYLPDLRPGRREVDYDRGSRAAFEQLFKSTADPFCYSSAYERAKYELTLSLLPSGPIGRALELACAEGHFSLQLGRRVEQLVATDFSTTALQRAKRRCRHLPQVEFRELDFLTDPLESDFELIVCSEALYYTQTKPQLEQVLRKVASALRWHGYLLTTHAILACEHPLGYGFDWALPHGADGIDATLSQIDDLQLAREICTPLYRVQLWQKRSPDHHRVPATRTVLEQLPAAPPTHLLPDVRLKAEQLPAQPSPGPNRPVPMLMYHRVAPSGAAALSRYRVTPAQFEQQLQALQRRGYYSISAQTWIDAQHNRTPLPGKPILLTFDDGYCDFYQHAFPLLHRYGFSAIVFLVADRIGDHNRWDAQYGEQVPLMPWWQIHELHAAGIEFGSHTCRHPFLTAHSPDAQAEELARSREVLVRELGHCDTLAYPYGDHDDLTQHLAQACGYRFAVTCNDTLSNFDHDCLGLPRIEVRGDMSLRYFEHRFELPVHLRALRKLRHVGAQRWVKHRLPTPLYEAGKRWYFDRIAP